MPHLVSPPTVPLSITACLEQLREAHAFLVTCASATMAKAVNVVGPGQWGTRIKRESVDIGPKPQRPELLSKADDKHSLAEVVNQCATIERLMDALAWAAGHEDFAGWTVAACHPTTSSTSSGKKQNDLELERPDGGRRALFEVSDVASDKDGNRKEKTDLDNLGCKRDSLPSDDHRRFLVVSKEFGSRFVRRKGIPGRPGLTYVPSMPTIDTYVLEIRTI